MNKYLVTIFVPILEEKYDCLIPNSKRVIDIIYYCSKVIHDLSDEMFDIKSYSLVNRNTGNSYDFNLVVSETDIRNGTELILI